MHSYKVYTEHVYMCLCLQVCERLREKESGRVNCLIRDVQVQPSYLECVSEGKKSASCCAGPPLKEATTPTWPQHKYMQETTGWLKTDTGDFFCGLLTHRSPSALLPQVTKTERKLWCLHTKRTVLRIRSPNIISQRKKVKSHKYYEDLQGSNSKKRQTTAKKN